MIGIYAIENIVTKECYVGQSKKIANRYQQHLNMLEKGEHHSHKLQKAFNQMGIQNFALKILELCVEDELDKKEQEWINHLNSIEAGYNIKSNGFLDHAFLTKVKTKPGIFIPLPPRLTEDELDMISENEQLMNQIGSLVKSAISLNHSLEKPPAKSKKENKSKTTQHGNRDQARRWAMKYYRKTGKIPGRVRIVKNTGCEDKIARDIAKKLKQKYGKKES